MIIEAKSEQATKDIGEKIGHHLQGGEVIELIGDVGAGKTTFTKGLAVGLGVSDEVQSPSFTVSRVYDARDDLLVSHYDFYRLTDAGIMANELAESISDKKMVTIIEWADIVDNVLPEKRLTIRFEASSESSRKITMSDAVKEFFV